MSLRGQVLFVKGTFIMAMFWDEFLTHDSLEDTVENELQTSNKSNCKTPPGV